MLNNNKGYVKTLKIKEIINNRDKYIIPIYQRNYAWGDKEISLLIQDLWNASKRTGNQEERNYYIGSLVVHKRDNGDFEVIDGQQRLTTLTLIIYFLKKEKLITDEGGVFRRNIFFEYRNESEDALDNLSSDNLPSNFQEALRAIRKYWHENCRTEENCKKLSDFLLEKVEIIRALVPENTDLNHYFEIMNTRGEQLEKHEILKARLMNSLCNEEERAIFGKIWDACSDMSKYIVMGLDKSQREIIFGNSWQEYPKDFDDIIKNSSDVVKHMQKNDGKKSILDLLKKPNEFKGDGIKDNEHNGSFNSVIDFSNLLMHVLRIYFDNDKDTIKNIPLDEKFLLKSFDNRLKDKEDVKEFLYTLLVCRYLFDIYVIKSSKLRSEDEHWSLWNIMPGEKSNYYYKNTFGANKEEKDDIDDINDSSKTIVMLLSMFHVSNPSRIYKNWLYAVLRWLFKNRGNISSDNYISFLENLCDYFYFECYCQNKDFTTVILNEEHINNTSIKDWNDGVNVPNFIFNRLDYQLWKKYKNEYPNFRFTFKSSVEHHYPQNPSVGEPLKNGLNDFGNLYLLSQSKNSRLSNLPPEAKKTYYPNRDDYDSLKQALMMKCVSWTEKEILEHGKEMSDILNKPISNS